MDHILRIVADMPVEEQKKVAEKIMESIPKEKESESMKREIETCIKSLNEGWTNLPEDWELADFYKLCVKGQEILNQLDKRYRIKKTEVIKEKATEILEAGFNFSRIEIDGESFYHTKNGIVDESAKNEEEIPF
jgi:hypothetical protein